MTADQLVAALKKWGVKYREYPGWRTRGRPGGITDARGILVHHTGSNSQSNDYLDFLFVRGRPEDGIPGPLCNVATDMDGDLHLGAVGRANHAGSGSQTTLSRVTAQNYAGYTSELRPGADGVNGNAHYYGNEIRYDGAKPMTAAAYRTALLYAAAVCDFHGWSALSVIAHREHTRRKNDPGHCPMNKFRTDLATVLKAGPDGDDMANADEVLAELRKFQAAEAQRYADLANRVQALIDQEEGRYADMQRRVQGLVNQEAGRYQDYVRRFNAILAALPNAANIPPVEEPPATAPDETEPKA
ncbi:N-acetylmuramoyl-L-alanine amidase [Kribbella amoyensis]|uniref:N-acetylmuramoyl-L-alanine amidase n=2 Tax=Kribbella amoyensis TaxID=996641 RepID=A0A561BWD9_9ACTN|nr:N-acetylmuramoyl-L-alanine amidase [Kribbella amoyensis]